MGHVKKKQGWIRLTVEDPQNVCQDLRTSKPDWTSIQLTRNCRTSHDQGGAEHRVSVLMFWYLVLCDPPWLQIHRCLINEYVWLLPNWQHSIFIMGCFTSVNIAFFTVQYTTLKYRDTRNYTLNQTTCKGALLFRKRSPSRYIAVVV